MNRFAVGPSYNFGKATFLSCINLFSFLQLYVSIIFLSLAAGSSYVYAAEKRNILVLHSYHQEFAWTDAITKEIKATFYPINMNLELFIEYMDVKRHGSIASLYPLTKLYKFRYQDIKFDVIILSDDFALKFVLENRKNLFPGVPIVFCGINDFTEARIADHKEITGVVEDIDMRGTINLALFLHPATKRIAIINDGSPLGEVMMKKGREAMTHFKDRLEMIELFDLSVSELKRILQKLPKDTVILHVHYFNDKETGKPLNLNQSYAVTRRNSKLPIYTGWDFHLGYGAIGGIVTSGVMQGRTAAKMAIRILNGEAADSIPIITESPNTPMFDYNYLLRHGISGADLPKESVIINEPQSFYYRYKTAIWLTIGLFVILLFFNINLILSINKRKKAEAKLARYQAHLEDLVKDRTEEIRQTNEQLNLEIIERKRTELEREQVIKQLETALSEVKSLSGLLPICSSCKKIRDDKGYWNQIESYIRDHSDADFSHGICPECAKRLYPDLDTDA